MWNYIVTAQKPTAVSHSLVGNFTSSNDLNLIISKCTRIEIHLLTPEGLQPLFDVGIYGRIATMELYRPPEEKQDLLFLSTERYKFCILAYDSHTKEIVTRAHGDIQDRIGRPADVGQIGLVDPDTRLIGLHMYDGMFKVIPMDSKGLKEAFNIRLEELQVIDIKFLSNCQKPTIAILFQDTKEARHVKTYEVNLKEKEFEDGPWSLSNVELSASILIPVPLGGAIIIGEQTITYHSGGAFKSIAMKTTIIKAYGKVDKDGSRYLLGDHLGSLFMLILEHEDKKLLDMKLEFLGETSIASTISYLDNGVIYIGSTYGDSQLLRLNVEKDENGYLEQLENFTNLGPIVDFCVVDLERQGQGQVVTCSGAFKDGSLRIIRNGIGINEQAAIDLPGIKGLWSLKPNSNSEFDKYIILSFVGETRVLAMNEEELEETEIAGFQSDEHTLYCGNVNNNQFLQITPKSINLVDCNTLKQVSKWSPPAETKITIATCNPGQVLIGTGGGHLVYIEIEGSELKEKSHKTLEHEISCLNMGPLSEDSRNANVCAVGMWTDITIRVLTLPDLNQVIKEPLGGEIIPRSVLLANFEGIHYLLCALGDGHLFTFTIHLDDRVLKDKKKLSLGTKPIVLNTFSSTGQTHVFAASDRPTVIYSANKKLLYSNVNLKEVNQMCAFNSASFPDSLAIATEGSLTIGTIDDIQKLHIRTIPLGEMPRRICHQETSNSFCVLTVKYSIEANGEEIETSQIRLIDNATFEIVSSFQLNQYENGCSVISCTFSEDENSYYIVGTAYALPNEAEPSKGRLLVFSIIDSKLKLVTELETKGAVYALNAFNGKLLAGVNSKIQLYKWAETEDGVKQLVSECGHHGHILALFIASRGDFIIVGDLMKSISLLLFKPVENVIEEIARDYNPNWMTAVEVLDDDTYIGAENSFNLFTVKKNSDAATDEERSRLELCGQFHLGEFVNRFRHGSLVMRLPEVSNDESEIPTLIFGTVNGVIGIIASLSQENFAFFAKVQDSLTKVIKGVGGFSHSEWRSFSNERKTAEARNFLDGDLIESFLDLKPEKMYEVAKGLDISVEELCKRIETLQQALH